MRSDERNKQFPFSRFIAPRFWLTWLGVSLLWLLSRFAYPTQLAIGRVLGSGIALLMPSRRKITDINLKLAFPDMSAQQRTEISKKVFHHIGMSVAEAASTWFRPLSFIEPFFNIKGFDNLQAAQASGKGVLILQAHFTLIEAAAAIMGSRIHVSAVVDNPKNELFGALLKYHREQNVAEAIENHNIRRMIRRLRKQECVWYSPDLYVPAHNGGIPTRYFDVPVLTTDGIARIIKLTNAVVLPYMPIRDDYQGNCTLHFLPMLEDYDASDLIAATQKMNDFFEAQIRQHPEQYFWVHKRFKSPSPDVIDPYR